METWVGKNVPGGFGRRDSYSSNRTISNMLSRSGSSGGHLAMSLAWTSISKGIRPPEAILAFYCPTNYEHRFWLRPNVLEHAESTMTDPGLNQFDEEIWSAISNQPLTGCTTSIKRKQAATNVISGVSPKDPRARLLLYMSRHGKTLDVLLNGLNTQTHRRPADPIADQIAAVSPLSQIRNGVYKTPTFIIHPGRDDFVPVEQSRRTYETLTAAGVKTELRVIADLPHLFDA
jgi:acetyl esterase/lipase